MSNIFYNKYYIYFYNIEFMWNFFLCYGFFWVFLFQACGFETLVIFAIIWSFSNLFIFEQKMLKLFEFYLNPHCENSPQKIIKGLSFKGYFDEYLPWTLWH